MSNIKPAIWFPTVLTNTGVDSFTVNLCNALDKEGFQTKISWIPHQAEYLPWFVPPPQKPSWANIIHINSWLHPKYYAKYNTPIITTCHGCVHDNNLNPYKNFAQKAYHYFWVRKLEALAFKNSTSITTVSRYTNNAIKQVFELENTKTIPNWINEDAYHEPKGKIPHKPFRLLFLGQPSVRKGADLLPEIMKNLGEGFRLFYTSKQNAYDFGLSKLSNTVSLGWSTNIKDIQKWIDQSDVLIFPSRMEGMPLAVLEAMARGLPIICTNSSSLPEIVENNINGIICQIDDINKIVQSIQYMQKNIKHWQEMSINGYDHAKLNFTMENSVEQGEFKHEVRQFEKSYDNQQAEQISLMV